MVYKVSKIVCEIATAHRVDTLPQEHQCRRLHGHNNLITIEITASEVDKKTGFVIDLKDFSYIKAFLNSLFDHRFINEVSLDLSEIENRLYDYFGLLTDYSKQLFLNYIKNPTTEAFAFAICCSINQKEVLQKLFKDNLNNILSIEVIVQETGLSKLTASYKCDLKKD